MTGVPVHESPLHTRVVEPSCSKPLSHPKVQLTPVVCNPSGQLMDPFRGSLSVGHTLAAKLYVADKNGPSLVLSMDQGIMHAGMDDHYQVQIIDTYIKSHIPTSTCSLIFC